MNMQTTLKLLQEETALDVLLRHGFTPMSDAENLAHRFMKHPDGRICLMVGDVVLFHNSNYLFKCKDHLDMFLVTGMRPDAVQIE